MVHVADWMGLRLPNYAHWDVGLAWAIQLVLGVANCHYPINLEFGNTWNSFHAIICLVGCENIDVVEPNRLANVLTWRDVVLDSKICWACRWLHGSMELDRRHSTLGCLSNYHGCIFFIDYHTPFLPLSLWIATSLRDRRAPHQRIWESHYALLKQVNCKKICF